MKNKIIWLLALVLCLGFLIPILGASATETEEPTEAKNISKAKYITKCVGFTNYGYFFDGQLLYGGKSSGDAYFTVEHDEGVGSIYIIFQDEYGPYTVKNNDTGETYTAGEGYFLHDFLDLVEIFGTAPNSVTLEFFNGRAAINEVSIYTPGEVPDTVQQWETPKDGETDLVLFSTHGDDEQLFFAGVLPYYGVERGYQVQVVYLTNHRNNSTVRIHEMLNGLWAVGVTAYPVFGEYDDFRTSTMEAAYQKFESRGWPEEEMLGFVVEQMRRFKPKVVVAHDFEGEYGHGQHMVYADLVAKALEISNDPEQYPELAEQYGTWDVPKAYFHLYEENEIVMDWDQPLESFDGETAFEVSIYRGFQCHKTQVGDFAWYYAGFGSAISLPKHNPCYYGLYRTTVGPDVEKNDFFENVTTHAQDAQQPPETEPPVTTLPQTLPPETTVEQTMPRTEPALPTVNPQAEQDMIAQEQAAKAQEEKIVCMILIGGTLLIVIAMIIVLRPEKKRPIRKKTAPRYSGNRKKKGRFSR